MSLHLSAGAHTLPQGFPARFRSFLGVRPVFCPFRLSPLSVPIPAMRPLFRVRLIMAALAQRAAVAHSVLQLRVFVPGLHVVRGGGYHGLAILVHAPITPALFAQVSCASQHGFPPAAVLRVGIVRIMRHTLRAPHPAPLTLAGQERLNQPNTQNAKKGRPPASPVRPSLQTLFILKYHTPVSLSM